MTTVSTATIAAAAIANAIKANGVLVRVEAIDFERILSRSKEPLVVYTTGGIFSTNHQYLTSYKGLAFFCKSSREINLPKGAEIIRAGGIWMPNY
ncbi:MAG: hypothetical protein PVF45_01825 [Anaerolineae bacterium]|jgi:hypothetical protein